MKALTITAQPKPEKGWVHRFRNFGEEVYLALRESCDVSIEEIDAAFDEFHVHRIQDEDVAIVRRSATNLLSAHHLDDSVFVTACDSPVYHQTIGIVLDTAMGEGLWEISGRHPIWIVGSEANRAVVEALRITSGPGAAGVTIWSNEFEVVTERDWLGVLSTLDMHHGALASDPPMNKLSVYGAGVTPPAVAALREHGFETILPTASGFIATCVG
jgi:hypothetical protein